MCHLDRRILQGDRLKKAVKPRQKRPLVRWAGEAYRIRLRLRELAATYVRCVYRRLTVLLRRGGWKVNTKRVYRLYDEEGLKRGAQENHALMFVSLAALRPMFVPRAITTSAAPYVPAKPTQANLRAAVQTCRGCDLYACATQAVLGEGPTSAQIVLIGEQPGDEEDRQGRPFVGPAGKLLDRALSEAAIDRTVVYVTNAVKHFKFEERGKRRLHKKPNGSEIKACRPWLEAEISLIHPQIVVCLGATAAQTIFGPSYRVTKERGIFVANSWAPHVTSTIHPSAILRAPDEQQRHLEYEQFVGDLKKVERVWKGL